MKVLSLKNAHFFLLWFRKKFFACRMNYFSFLVARLKIKMKYFVRSIIFLFSWTQKYYDISSKGALACINVSHNYSVSLYCILVAQYSEQCNSSARHLDDKSISRSVVYHVIPAFNAWQSFSLTLIWHKPSMLARWFFKGFVEEHMYIETFICKRKSFSMFFFFNLLTKEKKLSLF